MNKHFILTIYLFLFIISSINAQVITSNLPIIKINTNGQNIVDEPKIEADMGIIYNGVGKTNNSNEPFNNYFGKIGIEIRGQSSQMFEKKSFAVETIDQFGANNNVSLVDLPKENDWILYAPYTDKSLLRNVLTFDISRVFNRYSTRTRYCELYINDQYWGIYVLMEKIKQDKNRVNIAKLLPTDIAGDDLTGGYILKVDKTDGGYDGWTGTNSYPNAKNIIYQYNYPKFKDIVPAQKNYIKNYMAEFETALTGTSFKNRESGYNKYIEAGSFADFLIMHEITKEVDSYRYSNYLFKEKITDGNKIHAGPLWDFNLGYSNVDYYNPCNTADGWFYKNVSPNESSIIYWWKRLMEDSYFRNLVYTRYFYMRTNVLDDNNISHKIDSITNLMGSAVNRNYNKWPILGTYVWPNKNWQNNTYQDEVNYVHNWFTARLAWIDDNIQGELLYPTAAITVQSIPQNELNGALISINLTDEYYNRKTFKNRFFDIIDAPPGVSIDTVYYINAETAQVKLKYNGAPHAGNYHFYFKISESTLNGFQDLKTNPINSMTGIEDLLAEKKQIQIYASNHCIYINTNRPEMLHNKVEIYNSLGQIVEIHSIDSKPMNKIYSNLSSNIYFVKIISGKQVMVEKIVL